jgi:hypothetical protein
VIEVVSIKGLKGSVDGMEIKTRAVLFRGWKIDYFWIAAE